MPDTQVVVVNNQPTVQPVIKDSSAKVVASSSEAITVKSSENRIVDVFNPATGYGYGRNPNNPFTSLKDPGKPLSVTKEEGFMFVRFRFATGVLAANLRYVEVYRSTVDDIATIESIGFTETNTFTDLVDVDKSYFYWFRYVTYSNVMGDWYSTTGLKAQSGKNKLSFVSALNGLITEASFGTQFVDRLAALDSLVEGLQSLTAGLGDQIATETNERSASMLSISSSFSSLMEESLNNMRGERTAAISEEAQIRLDQYNALALTLDTLSARLDTEGAERSAAVTGEQLARISSFEALAADIATVSAQITDEMSQRIAAVAEETNARITWDESLAQQIVDLSASLVTNTSSLQAQLTEEVTTRTTRTDALAQSITDLVASLSTTESTLTAMVNQEITTRASNHQVLAQSVDDLAVEMDTELASLQAGIAAESTTRADAVSALAQTLNNLVATVTSNHAAALAAVTDEAIARVALDEAIAGRFEEFAASMDMSWDNITGDNKPQDNADVTANSQVVQDIQASVTAANNAITANSQSLTQANSSIAGIANLTASNTLKTTITGMQNSISGQATQITELSARGRGINLLPADWADPSALSSIMDYQLGGAGPLTLHTHSDTQWALNGRMKVLRLAATAANTFFHFGASDTVDLMPVTPGETYFFSVYAHQWNSGSNKTASNLQLYVKRFGVDQAYINYSGTTVSLANNVLQRVFYKFVCPADTYWVRFRLDNESFNSNGTVYQSYACFQFEQAVTGQTEPSPWVPGYVQASIVEAMQVDLAKAMAAYTLKLDSNGYVTSLSLTNDGSTSAFKVKSSNFAFYDDSGNLILGGGAKFKGTYIEDATIPSAAIASLAADKISATTLSAITANLGTCTAGIIKSSDGNFNINLTSKTMLMRSATTGQRTEYRNTGMKVYDAGNIARLEIGLLS
jgi:sulfur carrier protein ThiS